MTHVMRINEMAANYPVVDLMDVCGMSDAVSKETVNNNGREYYTIVFKCGDRSYGWYYHDMKDPRYFYEYETGYDTEDDARKSLMDIISKLDYSFRK